MSVESSSPVTGSHRIKRVADMLKGGVIATEDAVPVPTTDSLRAGGDTNPDTGPSRDAGPSQPGGYTVGDRVVFEAGGIAGSGVIDDVMPDGSVVWVWPDDAMGRKMLFAADVLSVRHEDESHKRRIRSR
ncbi:MAG: hypothetical protein QOH40_1173 [Arthrobacter pascens]|jgi:hypothetical protein|nr:hypothetical protein [Arthrobacter pascens]